MLNIDTLMAKMTHLRVVHDQGKINQSTNDGYERMIGYSYYVYGRYGRSRTEDKHQIYHKKLLDPLQNIVFSVLRELRVSDSSDVRCMS